MQQSKVYFTTFKTTHSENLLQKLHRLMKRTLILKRNLQQLKYILENMEILLF